MNETEKPPARRRRRVRWLIAGVGGIAAALVANMLWVDSRTRPATPRDGGQIIETGIELANVKVEGEGPAILLIHGFGAAMDWWDDIAPALAEHHRVIRFDLIGHGGTAAPAAGYEIARQAQLAAAVLEKLGVERVTVIGHSMGGEVAVALSCSDPQRIERMILIDTPPALGAEFTGLTRLYLTPVIGEALDQFKNDTLLRRALAQGFAPNFPIPDRFVADLNQLPYAAVRGAHDASVAYRTAKPNYEPPSRAKSAPPLLVISGSLDAIVPPESAKLFERVPGAKVAIIDGAGHSPLVEAPAKTLALIEGFLK